MIYLKLFLTFLKIGIVSFGGGYGMISLIRDDCLSNGWLSEDELLNFIAVAESTPGPIAVNMATFVGSSQAGALGSLLATFGIVLPSFVIILLVASVLTHFLKYKVVKAVINGIKPAIVALILGTALTMYLKLVFGLRSIGDSFSFDFKAFLIFLIVAAIPFCYKRWKKKTLSPIIIIIASGVLGVLFYGL